MLPLLATRCRAIQLRRAAAGGTCTNAEESPHPGADLPAERKEFSGMVGEMSLHGRAAFLLFLRFFFKFFWSVQSNTVQCIWIDRHMLLPTQYKKEGEARAGKGAGVTSSVCCGPSQRICALVHHSSSRPGRCSRKIELDWSVVRCGEIYPPALTGFVTTSSIFSPLSVLSGCRPWSRHWSWR